MVRTHPGGSGGASGAFPVAAGECGRGEREDGYELHQASSVAGVRQVGGHLFGGDGGPGVRVEVDPHLPAGLFAGMTRVPVKPAQVQSLRSFIAQHPSRSWTPAE